MAGEDQPQNIEDFQPTEDETNRQLAKQDAIVVLDNLVGALARYRRIMKAEARLIIREALQEI